MLFQEKLYGWIANPIFKYMPSLVVTVAVATAFGSIVYASKTKCYQLFSGYGPMIVTLVVTAAEMNGEPALYWW
jgi:hypothetical protein